MMRRPAIRKLGTVGDLLRSNPHAVTYYKSKLATSSMTLQDLEKRVWDLEEIRIEFTSRKNNPYVKYYKYQKPLPDTYTVRTFCRRIAKIAGEEIFHIIDGDNKYVDNLDMSLGRLRGSYPIGD